MKFMMLMIPAVYNGNEIIDPQFRPSQEGIKTMRQFNEEMGKAIKIESMNGLHPLQKGARVSFAEGKNTVTDGPFIESRDVLGGYWMVEAASKEEVVKWAQRCPAADGDIIEIRQLFAAEDFEP